MTAVLPPRDDDVVVVADDRLLRRRAEVDADRRQRRRRGLRRALSGLAVGVAVALVLWLVALSPALAVRQIVVSGAGDLDPASLREAAGLKVGQAVWSVDADGAAARLRRRAELRGASVTVRWPDTVEIRVTPRPAIARVVPDGGEPFAVTAGGVVIHIGVPESSTLMTVTVGDVGPTAVGDRLAPRLARSLDAVGQLPVPILLRVQAAAVDEDGEIRLTSRIGAEIRVGAPVELDAKMRAIEAALSGQVDLDRVCSLDVRNPASAVIRRHPDCDPPAPPPPPPAATPAPAPAAPATTPAPAAPAPAAPATPPAPSSPTFGSPGAPEPEVVAADPVSGASTGG